MLYREAGIERPQDDERILRVTFESMGLEFVSSSEERAGTSAAESHAAAASSSAAAVAASMPSPSPAAPAEPEVLEPPQEPEAEMDSEVFSLDSAASLDVGEDELVVESASDGEGQEFDLDAVQDGPLPEHTLVPEELSIDLGQSLDEDFSELDLSALSSGSEVVELEESIDFSMLSADELAVPPSSEEDSGTSLKEVGGSSEEVEFSSIDLSMLSSPELEGGDGVSIDFSDLSQIEIEPVDDSNLDLTEMSSLEMETPQEGDEGGMVYDLDLDAIDLESLSGIDSGVDEDELLKASLINLKSGIGDKDK